VSEHPLITISRELTKELFGNALHVGGYFVYDPEGKAREQGKPIRIIRGYFLDHVHGRLSNHWTWRFVRPDGSLSRKTGSGYGGGLDCFRLISLKKAVALARTQDN